MCEGEKRGSKHGYITPDLSKVVSAVGLHHLADVRCLLRGVLLLLLILPGELLGVREMEQAQGGAAPRPAPPCFVAERWSAQHSQIHSYQPVSCLQLPDLPFALLPAACWQSAAAHQRPSGQAKEGRASPAGWGTPPLAEQLVLPFSQLVALLWRKQSELGKQLNFGWQCPR